MELSEHLKKLRIDSGFSQEEVSEKSKLSLRTIQRLENGESSPREDTLQLLTKAFNVPKDYFTRNNDINMIEKANTRIAWFIISLTIIGCSLGIGVGITFVLLNKQLPNDLVSSLIVITIAILSTGIGLLVGNLLERKLSHD